MLKNLTLLNKTILDNLNENKDIKIVKSFTEVGTKILGADFGFVWLYQSSNKKWGLIYKNTNLPFQPHTPRANGRNHRAIATGKIDYVKNLKNTPDAVYVSKYMKSFVIIPISYREKAYGTIVLCFKKEESFSSEKRILCEFLGNGIAQVLTSHRSRERAQKLKEAEISLVQEKLKTEFIGNATHELRTPLAIIKGNVDMAFIKARSKSKMSPLKALQNINKEVMHLSTIVSNLALLTSGNKLQRGINYSPVNISKLLTKLVNRLKSVSQGKNISIKTRISKDIILEGDENYLVKLFSNLIRNAIIYGKQNGSVWVDVAKKNKLLEVVVSDNGIGMEKKDLPFIFDRFYRVDKSHNSLGKRTGLGLAIVKWVVSIHSGSISVTSAIGKGSSFKISLPIQHIK